MKPDSAREKSCEHVSLLLETKMLQSETQNNLNSHQLLSVLSVYQLMRPAASDSILQSHRVIQKAKRRDAQSLFILLRAHANEALVPFKDKRLILAFLL